MDSTSIELPGAAIESIEVDGSNVRIRFSRAIIIKTMTGSVERTKWWQAGTLVMEGASLDGELPAMPAICGGGDIYDNVYTYRDMVPIPLDTRGRVGCNLKIEGANRHLVVEAEALRLEMDDVPKYIEHLRPS